MSNRKPAVASMQAGRIELRRAVGEGAVLPSYDDILL
jgi:hypothetical protein